MIPSEFKEQNKIFTAPKGMDNCGSLPVFQNEEQIISCWQMDGAEKMTLLMTGKVWLGIHALGQPPVWLSAQHPFVGEEDKDDSTDIEAHTERLIERKVEQFIAQNELSVFRKPLLTNFLRFVFKIDNSDEKEYGTK